MQGKLAQRALGVLGVWAISATLGGYALGLTTAKSLGPDIMLWVGLWAGSIAGLCHVLILLINARGPRATS